MAMITAHSWRTCWQHVCASGWSGGQMWCSPRPLPARDLATTAIAFTVESARSGREASEIG